jgi:predicted AAA+ superfamily ATPase
MIDRERYVSRIEAALARSPVTVLLGPRQSGKTTLARVLAARHGARMFDLESLPDRRQLENPQLVLGELEGLIILDEIQVLPELFETLRVLVDRPDNAARFLVLGSASPLLVRGASESLAGRVELVELGGFDLSEVAEDAWRGLWLRGGFPRAFLADTGEDSAVWRENFIRTFLERDIPQLGIQIPAAAMRRFWTMLAHAHGQTFNASALGRSMATTDKTVRSYLGILASTFMVRQLQPWFENIGKRQVKSPKIYLRDSGLLHSLLSIETETDLLAHPRVGASWEGFALEQTLRAIEPTDAYFWGTHGGAELDLLFFRRGRRYGVEFKFNEAPRTSRSMHVALEDLGLEHLWVVAPVRKAYPVEERITVWPLGEIMGLGGEM